MRSPIHPEKKLTRMDDQQASVRHYAILIGIDAYPDRPLRSCVRDVMKLKGCLEGKHIPVNIKIFAAGHHESQNAEDSEWPTYRNITSAFEGIAREARRGDFVYIHYSGHGTRLDPCFKYSNRSTGDLALVLLEGEESRETHLRGPRLAHYLKDMVEKGLTVTLVLDCCFSGSVYRNGGASTRYMPYHFSATSTSQSPFDVDTTDLSTRSGCRDASMRDNWLLDPDTYTILAACGPHENAKGGFTTSRLEDRYGALSHFLYEHLCQYGFGWTHGETHRCLCARFRESCEDQNPELYGNADQAFFGEVEPARITRTAYTFERDGNIRLLAGQAHGLQDGDQLVVSLHGSSNGLDADGPTTARITRAGPLTSEVEVSETLRITRTTWSIELPTCSYMLSFRVRLAADLPNYNEWLEGLRERSLGNCPDLATATFHLVLSENIYMILDKTNQVIINLPHMPRDHTNPRRVCGILEHLARFAAVKTLKNEAPTIAFQRKFDIYMAAKEEMFRPEEQIAVKHEEKVSLVVENRGDTPLYIHVYNLNPRWGVKAITHSTYHTLPARNATAQITGKWSQNIKMLVPHGMRKHGSCNDVIKVFITSQPTSFHAYELPNLGDSAISGTVDRTHNWSSEQSEDWVAVNFVIRTSMKVDSNALVGT